MDDVRAVMDAASFEKAVLFGHSEGGPMSLLFAATYPERTTALILYGTSAKQEWDDSFGAQLAETPQHWRLWSRSGGLKAGLVSTFGHQP
jgi:pimeloyl-ACP methyl ester carboxylesterase